MIRFKKGELEKIACQVVGSYVRQYEDGWKLESNENIEYHIYISTVNGPLMYGKTQYTEYIKVGDIKIWRDLVKDGWKGEYTLPIENYAKVKRFQPIDLLGNDPMCPSWEFLKLFQRIREICQAYREETQGRLFK